MDSVLYTCDYLKCLLIIVLTLVKIGEYMRLRVVSARNEPAEA